jgi:hypothetical protein
MHNLTFVRKIESIGTPTYVNLEQFGLRMLATGMGVLVWKKPFVATFNIHPHNAYDQKASTYLIMVAVDEIVYIKCEEYKKYLVLDQTNGELHFADSMQNRSGTKFWPIANVTTDLSKVAMDAIEKHEKEKKP